MSDFVDELKDDLKQEQYAKLWHNYGNHVIAAIIGIVLATAGTSYWKHYQENKYEALGNALFDAYTTEQRNGPDASIKAYEEVGAKNGSVIATIAKLRQASVLSENGKQDEAVTIYKAVSEDGSNPEEMRQLAEFLYLQYAVKDGAVEPLAQLQKLSDKQGPFQLSAQELLAFAKLQSGDYAAAKKIFESLSANAQTPSKMKDRSNEMISAIEAKYGKNN